MGLLFYPKLTRPSTWCERCLLITESPKTPGHYRYLIWVLGHPSIDMHSWCRIPLLCDCLSIWCAIWDTKWSQLWHLRVSIFSPNSFAFIKFKLYRPQRLFYNDVSARNLLKFNGFPLLSQTHTSIDMHRHAECTIVWLSIDLMCKLRHKVITKFDTYGFQFFPRITITGFTLLSQTHTSIDMHSSCRIPLLCDCLSIWCAIWDTKWSQLWHLRVFFSRNHLRSSNSIIQTSKNKADHNDASASLI